jgi:type I restriction enzyme S subunit
MANSEALPCGWRSAKLHEVSEINPRRPNGFARKYDVVTSFVPMTAVDAIRGVIAAPQVRPYGEVAKGYTYFADSDVLFAKITPCMQNGKHAVATGLIDGIGFASTEFHVIRHGPELDPGWIHAFLRQPSVLDEATSFFTGAVGQQRVPDDFLANLIIPLPRSESSSGL